MPIDRCLAQSEEVALARFLAGYRGSTREAYALDLRQFAIWCANHERRLLDMHSVDIECFGRELEARIRAIGDRDIASGIAIAGPRARRHRGEKHRHRLAIRLLAPPRCPVGFRFEYPLDNESVRS